MSIISQKRNEFNEIYKLLNFKDLVIVIFHALTVDKREGTKQKVKGQAF